MRTGRRAICSNLTRVKQCDALFRANASAGEAIRLVRELTFDWLALLMSSGWCGLAEIGTRSILFFFLKTITRCIWAAISFLPTVTGGPVLLTEQFCPCHCAHAGGLELHYIPGGEDTQQNNQRSTAGTTKQILHSNVNCETRGIITAINRYYQLTGAFCSP